MSATPTAASRPGKAARFSVDVRAERAGVNLISESSDLTSDLPAATPGTVATLTAEALMPLGFSKAFSPATVVAGGVSRLTYTIDNTVSPIRVGSLAFTDAFPDGLAVARTPDAATTCGGTATFAPAASATSLAFAGGRVRARQSCTLGVDVVASRAGTLTSMSGEVTSDLPVAPTPGASAILTVNEASMPLGFSKAFSPATVDLGGISRLTFTIDNTASLIDVSGLAFTRRLPGRLGRGQDPRCVDHLRWHLRPRRVGDLSPLLRRPRRGRAKL